MQDRDSPMRADSAQHTSNIRPCTGGTSAVSMWAPHTTSLLRVPMERGNLVGASETVCGMAVWGVRAVGGGGLLRREVEGATFRL